MNHIYHVSYSHGTYGSYGFGSCGFVHKGPIDSVEKLEDVRKYIMKDGKFTDCIIISFQLLEVEESKEAEQ